MEKPHKRGNCVTPVSRPPWNRPEQVSQPEADLFSPCAPKQSFDRHAVNDLPSQMLEQDQGTEAVVVLPCSGLSQYSRVGYTPRRRPNGGGARAMADALLLRPSYGNDMRKISCSSEYSTHPPSTYLVDPSALALLLINLLRREVSVKTGTPFAYSTDGAIL